MIIFLYLIFLVASVLVFPYDYLLHIIVEKGNQSLVMRDCIVNDNSFFSSCLFTFGFYYVLPLLIIGLCYSRVASHVRRHDGKIAGRIVSIHLFDSQSMMSKSRVSINIY